MTRKKWPCEAWQFLVAVDGFVISLFQPYLESPQQRIHNLTHGIVEWSLVHLNILKTIFVSLFLYVATHLHYKCRKGVNVLIAGTPHPVMFILLRTLLDVFFMFVSLIPNEYSAIINVFKLAN